MSDDSYTCGLCECCTGWRDARDAEFNRAEAAEAKAAAMEAELRHASESLRKYSREATHPNCVTAEMVILERINSALHDHGGALAAHDAQVRVEALREAEAECWRHVSRHAVAAVLRTMAEQAEKKEARRRPCWACRMRGLLGEAMND